MLLNDSINIFGIGVGLGISLTIVLEFVSFGIHVIVDNFKKIN